MFNGLKLHKEFSGFQLCDITDPQLAEWINADENALDTFQVGLGSPFAPSLYITSRPR